MEINKDVYIGIPKQIILDNSVAIPRQGYLSDDLILGVHRETWHEYFISLCRDRAEVILEGTVKDRTGQDIEIVVFRRRQA